MASVAHNLCLERALWRQHRLFANGIDDLGGSCAQHGDSFEEWVSRASLGDYHEQMLETLNIGCHNLSQLFTQFFIVLFRS